MIDVVLLYSADADMQNGYERYEDYQEGRGDEFVRRVDIALAQLEHHPRSGSLYYQKYRKILVEKFPYAVFYVLDPKRIVVHAILDVRMDPEAIRRRFSGRE